MPEQKEHITALDNSEKSELLSSTPQKIIRWGVFTLFLLLMISLLLSFLIKYPDILSADMTMIRLLESNGENKKEMMVVLSQSQQPGQDGIAASLLQNRNELYIGQELIIKPEHYDETGMLKGIVSGMSKKCGTDSCSVAITLPDGFKTSFHKTLNFQPGMKGRADVIVKKQSLMQKMISALKQKLKRF